MSDLQPPLNASKIATTPSCTHSEPDHIRADQRQAGASVSGFVLLVAPSSQSEALTGADTDYFIIQPAALDTPLTWQPAI